MKEPGEKHRATEYLPSQPLSGTLKIEPTHKNVSRETNLPISRNQSISTLLANASLVHLFTRRDIDNLHQFGPASSQVRREARLSGSLVIQTGLSPCAAASGTSNLTLLAAK
jgi:hypothetical protein